MEDILLDKVHVVRRKKRMGEEESGAVSVDDTFYFFLWNLIAF